MAAAASTDRKIRLLIIDDSMYMRMAIAAICELREDIEIIGEAEDGEQGVALARELAPDVITMDLDMPGMDGITATKLITEQCSIPIIILSSLSEHGAELTFRAMSAGAVDFVCKSASALNVDLSTIADPLVEKIVRWGQSPGAADREPSADPYQGEHALVAIVAGEHATQELDNLLQGVTALQRPTLLMPQLPMPLFPAFLRFISGRLAVPLCQASDGLTLTRGMLAVASPDQMVAVHDEDGLFQLRRSAATMPLATLAASPALARTRMLVMILGGQVPDHVAAAQLQAAGHTILLHEPAPTLADGAGDELVRNGVIAARSTTAQLRALIGAVTPR